MFEDRKHVADEAHRMTQHTPNLPRVCRPGGQTKPRRGWTGDQEFKLVGNSPAIRALETELACAIRTDAKVLITGETGVGKEVVARLIHQRSGRATAPLVTLNCAGVPDSLLESELFGHVRGSFTDAIRDKPGILEMAPNGTVFLDEVGEMSMRMQVVLLRFLETGEIQRIGSDHSHKHVNVRLITATNRDLQAQIATGAFREDLYFRLNVIQLSIPPLRERTEDIPLLVSHFIELYSRVHGLEGPEISSQAMDVLRTYRWPGNIRELKNVIERLILKEPGSAVGPADLPADLTRPPDTPRLDGSSDDAASSSARPTRTADDLATLMLVHGESFWSVVYPIFMSRDLTRSDLRRVIHVGLESTHGNYRQLVARFNMPDRDYKRFLAFLRQHDCHLPFQYFRGQRH